MLLHGFGTCSFLWRAVAPPLASAGFTVVALDLLGHGESDRPLDVAYDLAAQAGYVERAMSALRLPAASVVGQDIGAVVAMLLAAQRPARVRQLALLSASNPFDLPGAGIRAMRRSAARAVLGGNALFAALPLIQELLKDAVADPAAIPPLLTARYLAPWVGDDAVSRLLQLASAVDLAEADLASLQGLSCPALLLDGAVPPIAPTATGDALISALGLRDARTEAVAAAARLIPEEQPAALADRLLAWMRADAPEGQRKS